MGPYLVLVSLALLQVSQVFAQDGIPRFTDVSELDGIFTPEDFPVGDVIGTVKAIDPEGTKIQYFISGDGGEYFEIGRSTGTVKLKKQLEFDTNSEDREIKMTIIAMDEDQQESEPFVAKINIQDVNDMRPEFKRYDIFEELKEDTQPGTLVATVSVTDVDTTNSIISVECQGDSAAFADACDKFRVEYTPSDISNQNWIGKIILDKNLDYEQRISFAILLVAKDGKFETTNEVHIEVIDINDSPPIWTRVVPTTMEEEHTIGSPITQVTANDGDKNNARDIYYEVIEKTYNDGAKFSIGERDGIITNVNRLDYDIAAHRKGVPYEIPIRAREIISENPLILGQDAITTSTSVISITITDIDDNTPTFNKDSYEAFIPENIATNGNVPGLQMTITDIDSGQLNSFDLVTLAHQDIFAIIPNKGEANAGATLYILDGEKIDFEKGPREYTIPVEARENQVPINPLTGSTVVTIKVTDVNDLTPTFDKETYQIPIFETDAPGKLVIDLDAKDPESGNFGTAGIRYTLFGNQQNHFKIDEVTGAITIGPCNAPNVPGTFPCIDYERKKRYVLTVSAIDDLGRGRTRSVQVIVDVVDINDNVPKPKRNYLAYIYEEQTNPTVPLIIKAEDPDTVGRVSYEMKGDAAVNWILSPSVNEDGEPIATITARSPAQFSWAQDPNQGSVTFEVISRDTKDDVISTVTIVIIDINNNAPEFSQPKWETTIKEDYGGDKFVFTVTASDGDAPTTGNGLLDFEIESGALSKFIVKSARRVDNNFLADIYTTPDATFNYDLDRQYEMKLVARDQGTPESKRGRTELIVNIEDINNKMPKITPSSVAISVPENQSPSTSVHKVQADDPDNSADLHYFMYPTRAQYPNGATVDKNDFNYEELFRIEEESGVVRVNKGLNRELTSFIVNRLEVVDYGATPRQTGIGALFITITEVNDQDPVFDEPFYNITIDEELNQNFFVRNLHCTDEDDQIAMYTLRQKNPRNPDFFTLMDNSGSLIVSNRIDFEKLERIELEATCSDDGRPQRSGSVDVLINIRNINDNSPIFEKPLYTAEIKENREGETYSGMEIVTVSATDIDKGDYGLVRYKMSNPNDPFEIDVMTGKVTVKPGVSFDREKAAQSGFQVIAYDSPNTPSQRRETSVPVYLTIIDINDNCPEFKARLYTGSIPESAKTGTDVLDTLATDKDYLINREISYSLQAGSFNPPEGVDYFDIGIKSGRVYTRSTLSGKSGMYKFNVTATDTAGTLPAVMCATSVPAEISVSQSQNYAPNWVDPPQRDWVIWILESQYEGMLVYNSKAEDLDSGRAGVVDYFFVEGKEHVAATKEFRINQVTGVIRAEIEYDREDVDTYFLTLVAVDQGKTTASSETTLIVKIMDVDDNDPIFESQNGMVTPLQLPEFDLFEDRVIPQQGLKIGQCSANDADSDHANNRIFYEILSEDEALRQKVNVDIDTCEIRLMQQIDFEETPELKFNIYAFNKKADDSVKRHKREVNYSILPVVIKVKDSNDNPPKFTENEYFACAALASPFNSPMIDLDAHDPEQDDIELTYGLRGTNDFTIDTLGIVHNKIVFPSSSRRVFSFEATVDDGEQVSSSNVNIFVTTQSTQLMFTVNRPSSDVRRVKHEYEHQLKDLVSGAAYSCADVLNHINDDGTVSSTKADVFMSFIGRDPNTGNYHFISGGTVYNTLSSSRSSDPKVFDGMFITGLSRVEEDSFGLNEDVVLAILIVTVILIVFAIILMILACYCIWAKTKKKKRKVKAARNTAILSAPMVQSSAKEESFSNPVYNNAGYVSYEDEYASVSKVRRDQSAASGPIAPVVIPVPENLEPVPTYAPTHLEPEVPEPVIETEVLAEPDELSAPSPLPEPEYETHIETTIVDGEDDDLPLPAPPAVDMDDIETEIRD